MYRTSLALTLMTLTSATGGDIGYIEDFALAKDRAAALRQLIPGTEDYYFYHALHALNSEQYDKARELMTPWLQRFDRTPRYREIETRLALLTYDRDPKKTIEFLRQRLGVQYNHQREILGKVPDLPTQLDQKLISRATLLNRSMTGWPSLENFEDSALFWLAGERLEDNRRRMLLSRLTRPDLPSLVDLVAADLAAPNSGGFGSLSIHRLMTLAQLDDLLKRRTNLLNDGNFVQTWMTKLQPGTDDDWHRDPAVISAYLDRMLEFVRRLSPAFNSLKANVLYHKLMFDRSRGQYDKALFLEYLKLPRQQGYIAKALRESPAARDFPVDLNADWQAFTLRPPIQNEEPLLRAYLAHFLVSADSPREFEDLLDSTYLKPLFAEVKILAGLGEPERWASDLSPDAFAALKNRVDIDFDPTNKTDFDADEPVTLSLHVKNVPTLIVKVFEINAANFYQQFKREIDTDINLDGLVANVEQTFNYPEPPLRRVPRQFTLPQLNKPGVYIVDFIGSGKSSRALVRKGRLRPIVHTGTAGQVISIVDEMNRPVNDASVWLGGTLYPPEQDGKVLIPFSTAPGRVPIVLQRGDFASLDFLDHQPEQYRLVAGIHVAREQLLSQRLAQVIVRPQLTLNGQPVSIKLLEAVKLRLVAVDADGIQSASEVAGFAIHEDRETIHEFRVPPRLTTLSVTFSAKVKSLSQNQVIDVADSQSFTLNGILATAQIDDVHLARFGSDYEVELLGRTGEPIIDRPLTFTIKHRDFKEPVTVTLKSDPRGRVTLGTLADIAWVSVRDRIFHLPEDQHNYRGVLDARSGDPIRIPWVGGELSRQNVSLFEVNVATIQADRFEALSLKDGMLVLSGLKAGDYELTLKPLGRTISIRVVDGTVQDGYVLGRVRQLELPKLTPVQIASIATEAESVIIRLTDASPFARVHLIASRYLPEYSAMHDLGKVRDAPLRGMYPGFADSVYLTGRVIGDEYRYVLDRKYQKKYPGNMLDRPELLLNPWAVRSTETGMQQAAEGGDFGGAGAAVPPTPAPSEEATRRMSPDADPKAHFANLDFLSQNAVLLANLTPDKDGIIRVKRTLLSEHGFLTVICVDPVNTTVRHVALPEPEAKRLDLRLLTGLDPKGYFAQQKQVSVLGVKQEFVLADAAAGRFETYDSLGKLFGLYNTLLKDPRLAEFEFITRWPSLKPEEKRSLYSKHACHELSFFIYKKDKAFFTEVVKPYLANKKDKTYLDRWLLEADVSEYTAPWRHGRLNVAERVLLGQRLPGEASKTARHLGDLFRLLPPSLDRDVFLFDTSISSSAMDDRNVLGEFKSRDQANFRLEEPKAGAPRIAPMNSIPPQSATGGGGPAPNDPGTAGSRRADQQGERSKESEKLKRMEEARKELAEQQREGKTRDMDASPGKQGPGRGENFYRDDRTVRRNQPAQLYRQVEPTQEWAENNYYKLPIQQQIADLVGINAFWLDYARHEGQGPFLSQHVAAASRNLTEVLLALAVTDLPFQSAKHDMKFDGPRMTFTPGGPAIVFHEEVKPAAAPAGNSTILVNQNFFKADDRYRDEGGERHEKFVTAEFVIHTVYGGQIVVTNPTPARQKLSVLVQIPVGALPLAGGKATRTVLLDLEPYRTQTIDYFFYFPRSGQYAHFPVQIAKNERLVAAANPMSFNVVDKPTKLDTESWDYVSQNGEPQQVIAFLERENINALNLDKIAWRMRDGEFFRSVLAILRARHVYSNTLWSYALEHGDMPAIREYLQFAQPLYDELGGPISTALVTYDPVERQTYEHLEYKPLVNARAHSLGQRRQIVNNRLLEQYHRFLKLISYRSQLTDADKLAVVYYLLLQDRVEEAVAMFNAVEPGREATKLQYDYCAAYLAMSLENPKQAREIAARHANHPVDRWRNAFLAVLAQVAEIDGKSPQVSDIENRLARQTAEAAKQPSFEFTLDNRAINLSWQNIDSATINFYLMDVELLFSRNPFVQQTGRQFAMIKPNATRLVKLPAGQAKQSIPLPEEFAKRNVLVEVVASGKTQALPYYANAMDVKVMDAYGQLKVTGMASGQSLPRVYVKAYVRTADGQVKFHKDGYTDLRGRFDYASVSTPEKSPPVKYSLLILSDEFGAVIREVDPPQR